MNGELYYKKYFEISHKELGARNKVWKVLCRYLQKFVPENGTVLDLGAGYCGFINNIGAREKFALDRSDIIRRYAGKDVTALVQSCADLNNFSDNYFDAVFASNLIEHLRREETEQTLEHVRRILKPGGRLILLQPNFAYAYRNYFDDFTHQQIFTHVSIGDLLEVMGFFIERVFPKFLPFSMRSRLPTHPLLVSLYLLSPIKPLAGQMLVVAKK